MNLAKRYHEHLLRKIINKVNKKFVLILVLALTIQGLRANTCSTATVLTVKDSLAPDTFQFSGTEYWFTFTSNTTVSFFINNFINGNFAGISQIDLYSGSCTGRQINLYSRANPDTIFMFRYTFTSGTTYYLKLTRPSGLGTLNFSALGTTYLKPLPDYCNYTDCQYIKNGSFSIVNPLWNQLAFLTNNNNLDHTGFCGWQRAWGMPHIVPITPPTTNPCAYMWSTNNDGGGAIVQDMSGRPLLAGGTYTITFNYKATGSNSGVINFVLPLNNLTYPLWNNVSDLLYNTSPVPVPHSFTINTFNSWVTNASITFTLPAGSNYPTLVIDPQSNNSTQLNLWIDNVSITESFGATLTATPPVVCSGGTTLTAIPNQTPPNPPYTYLWSTGATTQSILITQAGSYYVTVTNAIGCTYVASVKNIASSDLRASASAVSATCGNCDGSINLTVNGGTSPYTYHWSTGATTQNISSLCAGTYTVTITDAIGCTIGVSQAVGEDVFTNAHWPVVIPNDSCNGHTGNEVISNLTTDASGNVYAIGTFTGEIIFGKDTFCSPAACNCKSIFVAKYNHCGGIVKGRVLGYVNISSNNSDFYIEKLPNNNMAIAGEFTYLDCTSGGNPMYSGDGIDVFLASISPTTLTASSSSQQIQIHSNGLDNVKGISVNGNYIYIAGGFKGAYLYPGGFTAIQNTAWPISDLYVCQFYYDLSTMPWDKGFFDIYSDNGMTMQAVTSGSFTFLAFTYMSSNVNNSLSYISLLNISTGQFLYTAQIGTGTDFYLINDMKVIGSQLYLCGYKRTSLSSTDNKVALIYYPNPVGSIAWVPANLRLSNNTNNPSTCEATKLAINGNNVFVSGTFDATNFQIGYSTWWSLPPATLYGTSDHFVYKTDNTLTPASTNGWLTGVASGTGTLRGNALAYDALYGVYYIGGTLSGSFTLTGSAGQTIASNVGYDAYIARFTDNAQANYRSLAFYKDSLSKAENSDVIVYPNPAYDNIIISSKSNENISGYSISDLTGRIVINYPVISPSVEFKADISALAVGTYIVNVVTTNNNYKLKFLKIK
jgi:hypothetical protein